MRKSKNTVPSKQIRLTVDPTTEQILEKMSIHGFFGKNKAEVATWIIRTWLWDNPKRLQEFGIRVVEEGSSSKNT